MGTAMSEKNLQSTKMNSEEKLTILFSTSILLIFAGLTLDLTLLVTLGGVSGLVSSLIASYNSYNRHWNEE